MENAAVPARRLPSLAKLAESYDPFEDLDSLVKRLRVSRPEGKNLEWKHSCPIGPSVTKRTKYRIVKALVSFANTAGGFILCGVDSTGRWLGLDAEEVKHVDPAKLSELINGVVAPDLPQLNYREIQHHGRPLIILHTPPSEIMPHVTTKNVNEKLPDGGRKTIIISKAVYCRFGGKSDLATPACYQRIVARRTEFLRSDLLRRIREVPVPVPISSKDSTSLLSTGTVLRVGRLTDDPSALPVRLTNRRSEASGIFLHEELSDGLFDEINNVVRANRLLARGQRRFFLGEPLYYRVYAERQHIEGDQELLAMLAGTALLEFYAPGLFWLHNLDAHGCAEQLCETFWQAKNPNVHYLLRVACLLGRDFSQWLFDQWNAKWCNHPQPPDFYWTFRKMLTRKDTKDPVMLALRSKPESKFPWPDSDMPLTYGELLRTPTRAAKLLSDACMREFEKDHRYRNSARLLDFLAYGPSLVQRRSEIAPLVIANVEQEGRTGDRRT